MAVVLSCNHLVKVPDYVRELKPDKNIKSTRQWLKDQGILAVPYDKGTGFCLMKAETYNHKVRKLLEGPQFVPLAPKEKDLTLTEEVRVCNVLKTLQSDGKIDKNGFKQLNPLDHSPRKIFRCDLSSQCPNQHTTHWQSSWQIGYQSYRRPQFLVTLVRS